MRATTLLGAALIAISAAAVAQVGTMPVENKTDTASTNRADDGVPIDNATGANQAGAVPLGTVPGDSATAVTSAPPK